MTRFPLRRIVATDHPVGQMWPDDILECGHRLLRPGSEPNKTGRRRCYECKPLPAIRPPRRW